MRIALLPVGAVASLAGIVLMSAGVFAGGLLLLAGLVVCVAQAER